MRAASPHPAVCGPLVTAQTLQGQSWKGKPVAPPAGRSGVTYGASLRAGKLAESVCFAVCHLFPRHSWQTARRAWAPCARSEKPRDASKETRHSEGPGARARGARRGPGCAEGSGVLGPRSGGGKDVVRLAAASVKRARWAGRGRAWSSAGGRWSDHAPNRHRHWCPRPGPPFPGLDLDSSEHGLEEGESAVAKFPPSQLVSAAGVQVASAYLGLRRLLAPAGARRVQARRPQPAVPPRPVPWAPDSPEVRPHSPTPK